jgi:hypothetical protein
VGVVGGLHYGDVDIASLKSELQLVESLNPIVVGLSPHDSGPNVLDGFAQTFPKAYAPILVGQPILISEISVTP